MSEGQAKHTPGPWEYGRPKPIAGVTTITGWFVGPAVGLDIAEVYLTASQNAAVQEANARLIAAAPDLLAACQEGLRLAEIAVRQGLDFGGKTTEEIVKSHVSLVQIRAALAKATGPTDVFLAIGDRIWGRGATEAEAIANMKKSGGHRGNKVVPCNVYTVHADTKVCDDGCLQFPNDHRPKLVRNVVARKPKPKK